MQYSEHITHNWSISDLLFIKCLAVFQVFVIEFKTTTFIQEQQSVSKPQININLTNIDIVSATLYWTHFKLSSLSASKLLSHSETGHSSRLSRRAAGARTPEDILRRSVKLKKREVRWKSNYYADDWHVVESNEPNWSCFFSEYNREVLAHHYQEDCLGRAPEDADSRPNLNAFWWGRHTEAHAQEHPAHRCVGLTFFLHVCHDADVCFSF